MSRSALGPTQAPNSGYCGFLSPGVKLTTHLHLILRLAIPPTHCWSTCFMGSTGTMWPSPLQFLSLPLCSISLQQTPQSVLQNFYSSLKLVSQIKGDRGKWCNMPEWDMKWMNFIWRIWREDNNWDTQYEAMRILEWLLQKIGLNWIQVSLSGSSRSGTAILYTARKVLVPQQTGWGK